MQSHLRILRRRNYELARSRPRGYDAVQELRRSKLLLTCYRVHSDAACPDANGSSVKDSHQRLITYLRCVACVRPEGMPGKAQEALLTDEEMIRVAQEHTSVRGLNPSADLNCRKPGMALSSFKPDGRRFILDASFFKASRTHHRRANKNTVA